MSSTPGTPLGIAGPATAPLPSPWYASGDIINNANFEDPAGTGLVGAYEGLTDGSNAVPSNVSLSTTQAYTGLKSVKKVLPITAADVGSQLYAVYQSYISPKITLDRVYTRFYFFLDTAIDGTFKLAIHEFNLGTTQFGGLYIAGGSIRWLMDTEWTAVTTVQLPAITTLAAIVGAWHSLEVDYWRNGDTSNGGDFPSVAIRLDDLPVTAFNLAAVHVADPGAAVVNGRLCAGLRTTAAKLGNSNFLGVLNGVPNNTIAGNIYIDRVTVSTRGRIGP